MSEAQKIDGRALANTILEELTTECADLKTKGLLPGLALVLVGDDPASHLYVANKEKACEKVGIKSSISRLPGDSSESSILEEVKRLNADKDYHGIIVQLPLPKHVDEDSVVQTILPEKDVDGLTAINQGNLCLGRTGFVPCTPKGICEIFKRDITGTKVAGKNVVVVGRSSLVGRPIANLMSQKEPWANGTVTMVHSRTTNSSFFTKMADILIVAAGQPCMIKPDDVKPGSVIVDVGINRIEDPTRKSGYRFVGDVDPEAYKKASYYTPVPGGVGPLTVAMLLSNTVLAARRFARLV